MVSVKLEIPIKEFIKYYKDIETEECIVETVDDMEMVVYTVQGNPWLNINGKHVGLENAKEIHEFLELCRRRAKSVEILY